MGSKSSGAPAPDPRLVEAQIRSMGIQDDVIRRIMQQSDEMQPLQREQMQFGLDASRAAYNQSQEDRQWTLGKRRQLDAAQAPLLEQARSFNYDDRRADMMGEATADITQAFDGAEQQGLRTLSRMGVNPSDGKVAAMASAGAPSASRQAVRKIMRGPGLPPCPQGTTPGAQRKARPVI